MSKNRKEYIQYTVLIATIIFFRLFIFDVVNVEGMSMYPTLNKSHDKVVLEKYKKFTEEYNRGDIVVIDLGGKQIIKRIIGLPNETIEIKNGNVYINDKLLEENYLDDNPVTYTELKITTSNNEVFVLGDNRNNSMDSRHLGCIDIDKLEGKAVLRYSIRNMLINTLD